MFADHRMPPTGQYLFVETDLAESPKNLRVMRALRDTGPGHDVRSYRVSIMFQELAAKRTLRVVFACILEITFGDGLSPKDAPSNMITLHRMLWSTCRQFRNTYKFIATIGCDLAD